MLTIDTIPAELRAKLKDSEASMFVSVYNDVFGQAGNETMATAAALGAVNKARQRVQVRSAEDGSGDLIIEGWAVKFGDPEDLEDRDSYNEFFSRASHLLLEYYQNAPLYYEHGFDKEYGLDPIGMRIKTEIYRFGVWMTHRVYRKHRLFERTKRELEQGLHGHSTGAIGHGVGLIQKTGENRYWPAAECSITKNPAELALGPVSVKSFVAALEADRERPPNTDARDALEQGEPQRSSTEVNGGGNPTMDPQLLAALAEFLGVEATPEAVSAALQQLLTQIQGGDMPAEDVASMRSALKLDDKADVAASIKGLLDLFEEDDLDGQDDEDDAPPQRNFEALKRVGELAGKKSRNNMPHHTAKSNHQPGGKGVANFNRGAKKGGIIDVINAISTKHGRPLPMPAFTGKSADHALKAMNITEGPTGGYLLNRELSDEILEEFYPAFFIEQLGVERVEMNGIESLTVTKYRRGAQAYFVGEGQAVDDANGDLARITLSLKEIVAAARISNRLLAHSTGNLEQKVRADMINAMQTRAERACIYGTGGKSAVSGDSGVEPLGLLNTPGVNITTLGSGNGAQPKLADLENAEGRLEDNDVPESPTWAWLAAPRSIRTFKNMKDADGRYIFNREDSTLLDYKAVKSTLIRRDFTVGTSADCSHMFFGDWQHAAYGLGQDIELVLDTSVHVKTRETWIQMNMMFDFGVYFTEAFDIMAGVR
jgi:HK97 family phage major capsid protein